MDVKSYLQTMTAIKFDKEFSDIIETQNQKLPPTLKDATHLEFHEKKALFQLGVVERWVSKYFDVVVFKHTDGTQRLHINRRVVDIEAKNWKGDITWDELMEIKRQCGRGDKLAVEVFPADKNIINNQNIRHLWIIDEAQVPFVWAHKKRSLAVADDWTEDNERPAKNILKKTLWSG